MHVQVDIQVSIGKFVSNAGETWCRDIWQSGNVFEEQTLECASSGWKYALKLLTSYLLLKIDTVCSYLQENARTT